MLKHRILTAIVLFAILAIVLSANSALPFLGFLAITCALAGWEWTRITLGRSSVWPPVLGIGLLLLTLVQAYFWLKQEASNTVVVQLCAVISVYFWFTAVSRALYQAQVTTITAPMGWSVFACITLFATWGALADRYQEHGVFYILTLLIVIWVADIAAYFVGRAIGRHKLAPTISPGKTREGAMAGIAGVVIWLLVSAQWPESFGADLMRRWGLLGSILLAILLAIFSISGDLFESLLKRRAGVKDSSQLLPGHGGVFDRIDAVVAVVPLAYLLTGGWKL
ncbi:CdsA CDP-diglyceride synthetase [Burkholderiaceae bacterium]